MGYVAWNDTTFDAAHALQRRFGLIDLHVDFIIQNRLFGYDPLKAHRSGIPGQPFIWHTDLPRMREAGYSAACLGIHFWPWESERGFAEMNRQIDVLDRIAEADPHAMRVRCAEDWAIAAEHGLLALAPGVEGAHMLNGQLDRVRALARRGAAYLTICHFTANAAATPSMGRGHNERDGLTAWGRDLIRELERYGIVADVAHVNNPGVLDICNVARSPLLCTHTGVKGVCDVARNISDDAIDGIAATGGAIGVMFSPGFLARRMVADSTAAADHVDYIVQRVGIDHVALGSDYDGWLATILSDHKDCRDIVKVTDVLLKRGYTDEDLGKILMGNAARVLKEVWSRRDVERRPDGLTVR